VVMARKGKYQGKEMKGVALKRGLCFSAMSGHRYEVETVSFIYPVPSVPSTTPDKSFPEH